MTFYYSSQQRKQWKLLPEPDSGNVQQASTSTSTAASATNSVLTTANDNIPERDFEMPKKKRTGKKQAAAKKHNPMTNSIHPYQEVMSRKMFKLKSLCAQIGDLAACDLVIANCKSGVNNYHPNMDLADKMDLASKELITLSKKLSTKADVIRQNADAERDKKCLKEGIVFMKEVTDPKEKVQLCNNRRPQ